MYFLPLARTTYIDRCTSVSPSRQPVAYSRQVDSLTLALIPGAEFHRLWGADEAPTFPDDGRPTAQPSYFPPVGGYRFALFTVPPAPVSAPADLDLQAR